MRKVLALKEEWDVFKALCSEELMNIYTDENITCDNINKMINTLNALGFCNLAEELINYKTDCNKAEILTDEGKKDAVVFIKLFLENIKSDGLKERFSKAVQDFVQTDVLYEINRTFHGIRQEWEVFNTLCPKEYMSLIEKDNLAMNDYMKLILALENLGFSNIADDINFLEYEDKFETDEVAPNVFLKLPQFIKIFTDNLKSEGLRAVFCL